MIIGSYTLSVVCDVGECLGNYPPGSANFTAPTEGMARKKARHAGWRVLVSKETAICPDCAEKGLKAGVH